MKRTAFVFVLMFSLAFCFTDARAESAVPAFSVVSLKVGKETVRAELAATEEQRARGLMFRKRLGKNSGMLFDFGAPARVCMWMKNTLIPLSVAFIDQDGEIVNIADMAPLTTDSHCSAGWVVYALEMNRGWFSSRKIGPGSRIEGIPRAN
ncbi:MAG: DUF192 domain-containing protein [Alistipes senegalensis]|nr:DUF192 domain-containing protein [Oxalobacter formigenes]MCM1281383.1 DUF192 domain-containing protein [Alistipes senegalensis]